MDQDIQGALNVAISQALAQAQIPGAAIAVCIEGKPLVGVGIGHRDLHRQISLRWLIAPPPSPPLPIEKATM
ncbi:MAG: hypothetical protein ACFCVB_13515 [Nodosilinea sp.]